MVGACRQGGRQPVHLRIQKDSHLGQHGLAMGDRARLVQGQPLQVATFFQMHAALDQNALPRGGRQPADHRDRGGNDQCARAGDHQQRQCLVDPAEPVAVEKGRRHQRHPDGQHQHDGRVDGRKAVDEALGGRLLALRRLHRLDDARQRAVTGFGRHAEVEGTGLVDGAGKHGITRGLFHGQTLARDGRLVHRGSALLHLAIQRDALARPDPHQGSHRHLPGRHGLPAAIGLLCRGRVGRQTHQALDGVAGTVQRACLDHLRECEQHHHHRRFGPLPDQQAPRDRNAHQGVDVERPGPDGDPALPVRAQATEQHGPHRKHGRQPFRIRKPVTCLGQDGKDGRIAQTAQGRGGEKGVQARGQKRQMQRRGSVLPAGLGRAATTG